MSGPVDAVHDVPGESDPVPRRTPDQARRSVVRAPPGTAAGRGGGCRGDRAARHVRRRHLAGPARRDSDLVGVEAAMRAGGGVWPLDPRWEHALIVLDGAVRIDDLAAPALVTPGRLAYLRPGRAEVALSADEPARVLLLGGEPFPEPLLMWWNFVARTRAEITEAYAGWQAGDDRFGAVASSLARVPAPTPPWLPRHGDPTPTLRITPHTHSADPARHHRSSRSRPA